MVSGWNFTIALTNFNSAQDVLWSCSSEPTSRQPLQARRHKEWVLVQAFWELAFLFWQVALRWNVWDTCARRLSPLPIWVCPCLWLNDMDTLQSVLYISWMGLPHMDVGNSCQSQKFGKILTLSWSVRPAQSTKAQFVISHRGPDFLGWCSDLPDQRLRSDGRPWCCGWWCSRSRPSRRCRDWWSLVWCREAGCQCGSIREN